MPDNSKINNIAAGIELNLDATLDLTKELNKEFEKTLNSLNNITATQNNIKNSFRDIKSTVAEMKRIEESSYNQQKQIQTNTAKTADYMERMLKIQEEGLKLKKEHGEEVEKIAKGEKKISDQLDDQNEKQNTLMQRARDRFANLLKDGVGNVIKAYNDLDTAISKSEAQFGMTTQNLSHYKTQMMDISSEMRALYGTTSEQIMGVQRALQQESGRTMKMSTDAVKGVSVAIAVVGDEGAKKMANGLTKMGQSVAQSMSLMNQVTKQAQANGLSISDTIDKVSENFKYLGNYAIKDGLAGLERMTVESMKFKVNMESVVKFAEKVSTIEGALTTSANLQVLGGSFGMNSDPMSMLYNANNDIEGLQKQMGTMTKDLMTLKSDGTIDFKSNFTRSQAKAAAQQMGWDFNEMVDSARAQFVYNSAKAEMAHMTSESGFTEEMKNKIAANATYNKNANNGKGGWVVTNDEGKEVELNKLTAQMWRDEFQSMQNQETNIANIASDTRSIAKMLEDAKTGAYEKAAAITHQGVEMSGLESTLHNLISEHPYLVGIGSMVGGAALNKLGNWGLNKIRGNQVASKAKDTAGSLGRTRWNPFGSSTRTPMSAAKIGKMRQLLKNPTSRFLLKNGSKIAKGGSIAGGVLEGITTGLDYESKGAFDSNESRNTAIGGTAGAALTTTGAAALGAAIGTAILPGIGTAVGAFVGGIAGSSFGRSIGEGVGEMFTDDKDKASAFENHNFNTSWGRAASRLDARQSFYDIADSGATELDLVREIAKHTFDIRMILEREYGGAISEDDIEAARDAGVDVDSQNSKYTSLTMGLNSYSKKQDFILPSPKEQGSSLVVSPNGDVIESSPYDTIVGMKKGGAIDSSKGTGRAGGDFNVNFSGSIKLDFGGGVSVDMMKSLANDQSFRSQITQMVVSQMNKNVNGGRNAGSLTKYTI